MKKMLGVLGVGAIVGVIAYIYLNKNKNVESEVIGAEMKDFDDQIVPNNNITKEDFLNVKSKVASEVVERHEAAAHIMKDAMDVIYKQVEETEEEDNDLKYVSEGLNDLLEEG